MTSSVSELNNPLWFVPETGTQTEADSDTKSKFFLESDSSDEDSESKTNQLHASTQTSDDFSVDSSEDPRVSKATRSLNKCIEVFRSQVSNLRMFAKILVGSFS